MVCPESYLSKVTMKFCLHISHLIDNMRNKRFQELPKGSLASLTFKYPHMNLDIRRCWVCETLGQKFLWGPTHNAWVLWPVSPGAGGSSGSWVAWPRSLSLPKQ